MLYFVLSFFFCSPNLSRRILDVFHTSTHGVECGLSLVQIYDAGLKPAARGSLNAGRQKSRQKSPSRAISSQLKGTYRQSEKNLLSANIMSSTCHHNMVNFGLLAAEIGLPVCGTAANFNGFRVLAALLHYSQVVIVSETLGR